MSRILQSLATERKRTHWLIGYGILIAAFAWTHYFAFFAVAGQLAFVALYLATQTALGKPSEQVFQFVRDGATFALAQPRLVDFVSFFTMPWSEPREMMKSEGVSKTQTTIPPALTKACHLSFQYDK